MYKQSCQAPLSYACHAAGGIRTVGKPEDAEKNQFIVSVLFETASKCRFAEYNTRIGDTVTINGYEAVLTERVFI
ncbi:MAG: hypothetical protein LUG62_09045 [Clostridiales bacterium]|nr:hypothetical protein [Clostridiales bacterium]